MPGRCLVHQNTSRPFTAFLCAPNTTDRKLLFHELFQLHEGRNAALDNRDERGRTICIAQHSSLFCPGDAEHGRVARRTELEPVGSSDSHATGLGGSRSAPDCADDRPQDSPIERRAGHANDRAGSLRRSERCRLRAEIVTSVLEHKTNETVALSLASGRGRHRPEPDTGAAARGDQGPARLGP